MNSIKAIALKRNSRAEMEPTETAQITVDKGILGDFRGPQRGRQVTILSEAAWQNACAEINTNLPWTTRRANLLIDGTEFDASYVGRTVRIGEVELRVTEETNPCSRMDEYHQGLAAALTPNWRGGICCDVINAGTINIGDQVEFV